MTRWVLALSLLIVALAAGVAAAQQVEIKAPTPPPQRVPETIITNPGLQYEITQPDDSRYMPPAPRVHHDPAFIGPLSTATETPTSTGRIGLAGWTAPSTAMGGWTSGARDITGYFALGFAFEWGGPPPAKRPVR
jgi:hypothetical protein